MYPLRYLFLDFNSYFASVEQQLKPDLRGEPVIVVPVMTDATSAIAASYEAKALGIKTGTPVYEAKRICKNLKIVVADHHLPGMNGDEFTRQLRLSLRTRALPLLMLTGARDGKNAREETPGRFLI